MSNTMPFKCMQFLSVLFFTFFYSEESKLVEQYEAKNINYTNMKTRNNVGNYCFIYIYNFLCSCLQVDHRNGGVDKLI